uniref:Cation/H+ exchanger transmembrane domain-containing protein n=1 Tax=Ciona savignyi TaxID=51511 RepID=H2Z3F2_CIOSA
IQTGIEAEVQQQNDSMKIFFILLVLGFCILLTHCLLRLNFHFLPESIAVVFLGAAIGGIVKIMQTAGVGNWLAEEMLSPNTFFLMILPPIIFEAGYSLHKGNFFQNFGSILIFAVFGTLISALFVGGGLYLMGVAGIAYNLTLNECFAFGSLVSAVDPVATIAIFKALNVDPTLNMLVFGESILNDAVAIVLTNTFQALKADPKLATASSSTVFFMAVGDFLRMMFGSALLGVGIALISALISFLTHLFKKTPSLELGMMFIFAYVPYGLAESLKLSETSVFAYLGLAIFGFEHNFQPAFVIWSIILLLVGRGLNIYPLSWILNYFRETKITKRMQFIMWFSGLRGAICYVLSLHLELDSVEKRHVIITTSLIIVLFTILVLGGATLPVVKFLQIDDKRSFHRNLTLSKTEEMGQTIESDHISELTEEEYDEKYLRDDLHLRGFAYFDAKYLVPFFTRRITKRELIQNRSEMQRLTNKWYEEVRSRPSPSDEETEI